MHPTAITTVFMRETHTILRYVAAGDAPRWAATNGIKMRIVLSMVLSLGLLAVLTRAAYACECLDKRSPREEMRRSKVVFVGTVVEADVDGRNSSYRLRVEKSWKGSVSEFITISTADGTCSHSFDIGERYLVYALVERNALWTNICMRTAPLRDAAKDLKVLGRGKVIKKASAGRGAPQPNNGMHPAAGTELVKFLQWPRAAGDARRYVALPYVAC